MTAPYSSLPALLTFWLLASPLHADALPPLASCDTTSPRTTLESFQLITREAETGAWAEDRAARLHAEQVLRKAMRCLDVSKIPRERIDDEGETATILLQEVLDRIEIPSYLEVPDARQVREEELSRWTVPNTEIEIAKVEEGPRQDEWLFSPETVARLKAFYREVEDLPYRTDAVWGPVGRLGGVYTYHLLLPEPSMPSGWIAGLPGWATTLYLDQPVWKWLEMVVILVAAVVVFALIWHLSRRVIERRGEDESHLYWPRLLPPIAGVVLVFLAEYLVDEQINVAGRLDAISETSMWVILLIFSAWAILAFGEVVADAVVRSPRIQPKSVDASLITITARVVSFGIAFWVVLEGAEGLGLSLVPLFAGLGVGGLAIALAVRPTFENLIGGFILFVDKPVRVGDHCVFGDQEGFVEQIGLRSTRIRTLKDTLVSVPNAEFSQLQLENISRRKLTLYRTVLGLRYETTAEQLRYVLARLREMLVGHPMVAPQRLRVRFLGFGSYSLDVELFAYFRTNDFGQYWAMREDLNLRIIDIVKEAGTSFAFPSSTAYFTEDVGLDAERGRRAEARVTDWRNQGELPFPEFGEAQRAALEDKLDYPPKGSSPPATNKRGSQTAQGGAAAGISSPSRPGPK